MLRLLVALVLFFGLPAAAIAQSGLGQFSYIGKQAYRPQQVASPRHPSGTTTWRFNLPGGSCNDVDCRTDRERAQLVQSRTDNEAGQAYRYTLSFFLPADFPDVAPANLMLWEVKPRGDGKPSAVIEIIDRRLQFTLSDPRVTQGDKMRPEQPIVIQSLGAIPRGRWTDIVIDASWSRGGDGVVDVYHNGRRAVAHRGPNIDSNSARQRVMFGVYRSFISRYTRATGRAKSPTQEVFFANVGRQRIRMN